MEYPSWLGKADSRTYEPITELAQWPVDVERAIEMAKDAWDMAYNAGTEGVMSPAEFCEKYQDMPNPNDGARV